MTTVLLKRPDIYRWRHVQDCFLAAVITLAALACSGCAGIVSQTSSASSDSSKQAAAIAISANLLPAAQTQGGYSAALSAAGGTLPYTWALLSGGLPAGLTLSSAGVISGTPTQSGSYTFSVQVSDSSSPVQSTSQSFTLTVSLTVTLAVSTSALPSGATGSAYSSSLAASGGTGPYTWAISSGSLPPGVSLNASTGALTGTPATAGTFAFTAQATDSSTPTAQTATKSLSIVVVAPLSITTASLGGGKVGTPYSQALTATGGTVPYAWSLTSGTLPTGLSLNSSTGLISGTPTAAENITPLTIEAVDAAAPMPQTSTVNLTISVIDSAGRSAVLTWGASPSSAASGYNVYRSNVSGSGYAKVNSVSVSAQTFTDVTVTSGETYYYVVTAVDSSQDESGFSNEMQAAIP